MRMMKTDTRHVDLEAVMKDAVAEIKSISILGKSTGGQLPPLAM